jgi:ferritin-like metal-binding protein YciE
MNWLRELYAHDTKKAMSMIKKEISDIQSKALRPLTKSLEAVEKRIKDLEAVRDAIGDEHMKVYDLEKKLK